MHRSACWLLVGLLSVLAFAQAKEFWVAKDYQQWSEKECRKLLDGLPWALDYTLKDIFIANLQQDSPLDRGRQASTTLSYLAQFRSALPVRQAVARQMMFDAKYDKLTPEQRHDLDARIGKFLATSFADKVLVHVIYKTNVPQVDRELARYWQTRTLDTIVNTTNLIVANGDKVQPTGFVAATGGTREFQLTFPRQRNGQPIVGAADKTLKLEFMHPNINNQRELRILLNFKPEQMKANGELVY